MSGIYTVTITNAIGCSATNTTTVIVNASASVNLGPDIIQLNPPVILNAGPGFTSYSWNTGPTTQSISVSTNGQYIVTVFNGCTDSDTIQVNFTVGIENEDGSSVVVNLYPNPTDNGDFNVSIENLNEIGRAHV